MGVCLDELRVVDVFEGSPAEKVPDTEMSSMATLNLQPSATFQWNISPFSPGFLHLEGPESSAFGRVVGWWFRLFVPGGWRYAWGYHSEGQ